MSSKLSTYLNAWLFWKKFKRREHIDDKTVVLVMANENIVLDECCIRFLPDFIKRKYANRAIVIVREEIAEKESNKFTELKDVEIIKIKSDKIDLLYSLYCYYKFFDNIVFTFTSIPQDNLLKEFLEKTEINEKDVACLALYHLRNVPE